jgi:hypothetical protein
MAIPEDDEKTRIIRRPGSQPASASANEETSDDTNITDRVGGGAEESEEGSDVTRLISPLKRPPSQGGDSASDEGGESDPVVGWLVVVAGPGRGHAIRLGYGQNSIGRDREERVRIDFGDGSISRKKHCFVIYEPRKRQFILRPGDSANLAYLNGELVSESRPLTAGAQIEVGKTTLRFVPLCGPDFEWQEQSAPA